MPVRVRVRAVIWVDGKLVVHRDERQGRVYVTLPGGRVNERESVIAALERELVEELGAEVEVGDLVAAAEVFSATPRQDVELIFAATLREPVDRQRLTLIDPSAPEAASVRPPVLPELARRRDSPAHSKPTWLGNVYTPHEPPTYARAVSDADSESAETTA